MQQFAGDEVAAAARPRSFNIVHFGAGPPAQAVVHEVMNLFRLRSNARNSVNLLRTDSKCCWAMSLASTQSLSELLVSEISARTCSIENPKSRQLRMKVSKSCAAAS